MNKNLVRKILIGVILIGIMFSTILAVYTGQNFFTAIEFDTMLLLEFIGSVALVLILFIVSFYLMIKILGGKSNGKNSEIRKDKDE
ncbi:hypothetical protein J6Y73_02560 [bacterium]|nr:hypothetical protein [bacterium]